MKVNFEGHRGLMWSDDDSVIFYGVRFNTISDAIRRMLRHVKPSTEYKPWCCGRYRGIMDAPTGRIFTEERWFDNEKDAEIYLKHVAVQGIYKN